MTYPRLPPAAPALRALIAAPRTLLPAIALAIMSAHAGAWAAPARYELDPVHTRVLFSVSHAGFSQALGTVSGSAGTLEFDPDDWTGARLEVSVPLQRLDLGDAEWNRATLARNLLDAQRWPEARFVSTRIEPLGPDHFIVHGQLTLRDVTREVPLEVRFNALKRHPLPPFRRTAGFSATTTVSRADFGIKAWPSVIGDRVELRIEAEAVRSARTGEAGDGGDEPAATPDAPPAPPADEAVPVADPAGNAPADLPAADPAEQERPTP